MSKFGSIDIGSNTVRLLIMETDATGGFREVNSERVICRLGEGIDSEKRLLPHRMELTLEVFATISRPMPKVRRHSNPSGGHQRCAGSLEP